MQDYDYTLVSYSSAMEALIYDLAKALLVEQSGYPPEVARKEYGTHYVSLCCVVYFSFFDKYVYTHRYMIY
jgi:hypothetical protein